MKAEEEDSRSYLFSCRIRPSDQPGESLMDGTGAQGRGVTGTKGAVCFRDDGGFPFRTGQVGRMGLGIRELSSDGPGRKATVAGD